MIKYFRVELQVRTETPMTERDILEWAERLSSKYITVRVLKIPELTKRIIKQSL